jgi:hypothetical protein
MSEVEQTYSNIKKRLHRIRQLEKVFGLITGVLFISIVLFVIGFIFIIFEAIFYFEPIIRTIFVFGYLILGSILIIRFIIQPIFSIIFNKHIPSDDHIGLQIGKVFPNIKDRLTDAIQIYRDRIREKHNTSEVLAVASLKAIEREVSLLDFRKVISKIDLNKQLRILAVVLFTVTIGFFLFNRTFIESFNRICHPRQYFAIPSRFSLILKPGNIRVIYGDDVEIKVEASGDLPSEVSLLFFENEDKTNEVILKPPFIYKLSNIKKSVEYIAKAEKVQTPLCKIEVVQLPLVRTLQVKLISPEYSRLGILIQESNVGEIKALKGSRVEVRITTNNKLEESYLVFEDGKRIKMDVLDNSAMGYFSIKKETYYWIELVDSLEMKNKDPIRYSIKIIPDLNPIARIILPGKNIDIDEKMEVDLTVEGEDDYGISLSRVGFWIREPIDTDSLDKDTSYISLEIEEKEPIKVLLDWNWNLKELDIYPEDVINYFFEIWDNDRLSGPKSGRSNIFSIRFPSVYEIFKEIEVEQTSQMKILDNIYSETRELKEHLDKLSDEMKGGKEIGWEEKTKLENQLEKQQEMKQEIGQLKQDLDNLIDRMERYELLSTETLQKYSELQKLYDEIATPELQESMKNFQEALKELDEQKSWQKITDFNISQETLLKSIERTMSILKRLQTEQKTDELIKKMEDLIERQNAVNQQLEQRDKNDLSGLSRDEQKIMQDTEKVRKQMDQLHQMMSEIPQMPMSPLEAAMETMDQEDLINLLEQTEQMMKSGEISQAGKKGSKAKQTMNSMLEHLMDLKKSLQQNQKGKLTKALRRTTYRLIQLSQNQEDLMKGIESGEITVNEATENQMSLLSGSSQVADSLYKLSKETFFVTPKMGKALGQAMNQMRQALSRIESSGNIGVSKFQGEAMGSLNQAVLALQEAMSQMAAAQSGLGMEDFFMQLDQIGEQQMALNQKMQQMMAMLNQGKMTLGEQAAMSRLANEQEKLKKRLEQLIKKYGEQPDIPGRLGNLAEKMGEIVRELRRKKANQKTIEKQEKILSRLLDAQHSLHRRDYSRKREARTGRDMVRSGPDDILQKKSEMKDRVYRDLLRISKDGYTQDYQELIRKYFEAVVKEEK